MLHDDLTFLDPVRYALGSGAKKDILKRLACENEGISYAVSTASMLADTMASYYKVLAPMLTTCKVRWIEYTDIIGATTFLHNLRLISAAAAAVTFHPLYFALISWL